MPVDLVLHSGGVFTGTVRHPYATAVAVDGGRVVAVGTDADVRGAVGAARESVDLAGRLVTPGFTDAHVHPVMGGMERLVCDLTDAATLEDSVDRVAAYARSHPDEPWVVGGGWMMAAFPGGTPTKELLDAVVPDRPVYLLNRDHHGAWVNSRALEVAGVDASTPDPPHGRLERDADGTPAGTLHEGAMDLVGRVRPKPVREDYLAGLLEGQRFLHALGVTGWQDAIVGTYGGYEDTARVYRDALDAGRLTARVVGAQWWARGATVDDLDARVAEHVRRRDAERSDRFRLTSVKIMVDGVAENYTASMREPYLDACGCRTGNTGLSFLDPDVLRDAVVRLDAAGFQVHVHAIGDRAIGDALDAFAAARGTHGGNDNRHHVAHLQVVHTDDVARFAAHDVAVNMQALWACRDDQMVDLTLPFLGEERAAWQYPFGDLVRAGARPVMGSDWPVSSPDPLQAIHVAVNRVAPGEDAEPLLPGQALDVTTALGAYTSGSAWVNHEDEGGVVREGARADLAVLDRDVLALPADEIASTSVDLTLVGGRPVFAR
ncbi:MAG: amidohydrolase [Actinomycetes bacterium]